MSMRALGGVDRVWSGARPQRVTPPPAKPRHLATGGRIGQTSPFAPVLEEGAETRRAEADADRSRPRPTGRD